MALKTITHLGVIDYLFRIKGEYISMLPIYVTPWMFEPYISLQQPRRNGNRGINDLRRQSPGMLLSISFEPDLSHTSILYYLMTLTSS
jgi:hypothetical protein